MVIGLTNLTDVAVIYDRSIELRAALLQEVHVSIVFLLHARLAQQFRRLFDGGQCFLPPLCVCDCGQDRPSGAAGGGQQLLGGFCGGS